MSVHSVFWVYSSCGHQRGEICPHLPDFASLCSSHSGML